MNLARRLAHRVTGKHTWALALVEDSRSASVHLTCRPCRINRPIPQPQYRLEPCFCRDAACDGWQAYVARFIDTFGVAPTQDDIDIDTQLHAAKTELIDEYGTGTAAHPFLAAFALLEQDLADGKARQEVDR